MNKLDLKIVRLAYSGKSCEEIAKRCGISVYYVYQALKILNNKYLPFYNPVLYNQLLFKNALNEYIIDKDYLEEIGRYIKKGLTLNEIALLFNKTLIEIEALLKLYQKPTSPFY